MFAAPAEGTLKHFMEFAETGFADHEPTVVMMPTGSETLPPKEAPGQTSRRDAIATTRSASAPSSTASATWLSGSSTRSNSVVGSQRAMTNSPPTTLRSSSLRRSGYGCALMSPRPSQAVE
jgi:hypothetical protein